MRPRRSTVALAALLLPLVVGCGQDEPSAAGRPASAPDPGVAHVHGLGVDPADGVLYAATHFGLFALPEDDEATRVADRFQDTMGFTVVGPRTFLGSGHPDVGKDPQLPSRLGLIRSTDAGSTWQSVSLSGEADFHVLRSAHGRVYGWEAGTGRLMVSADGGATWQTRSRLGLRDLVVSPDDPQVLLATTEQGLVRSTDGGTSFRPLAGPPLVVLAWEDGEALYGLDNVGRVHASTDGGGTWMERGLLKAPPEALAAEGDRLYAAVTGRGVLESGDGGRTWEVRYSEAPG